MANQIHYGRHVIKAMATRSGWAARAFRHDTPVGTQQSGETAEAAVMAVKLETDSEIRRWRDARDVDAVPTMEVFVRALSVIDASA